MKQYLWVGRRMLLSAFFTGGIVIEAETSGGDLSLRWEMNPRPGCSQPADGAGPAASCGCPIIKDRGVIHQRGICTDPVITREAGWADG